MSDWKRWHVPGIDANAHPDVPIRLGLANAGTNAIAPNATVRMDDMVSAMIQESDNSLPDDLRYRNGDQAHVDAAAGGDSENFEAPSVVADILSIFDLELADAVPGDRPGVDIRPTVPGPGRGFVQVSTYEDLTARVESSFAAVRPKNRAECIAPSRAGPTARQPTR